MEVLAGKILVNKNGDRFNALDILEGKSVIILLFASSKCKGITKILDSLKVVYEEATKIRCGFEIVLIANESSANDYNNFFKRSNGPWYAIPFEESSEMMMSSDELKWRLGVSHIPYIIVMKPNGNIISVRAIEELEELGINVIVAWTDY